ncbi:MAG: hypothetical protein LBU89_10600 [Fibromonadaceae bacterium]|nr:hypothetical protein [Fibromonadaceae bacterium]
MFKKTLIIVLLLLGVAFAQIASPVFVSYEAFLDSIETYATAILSEKEKLELQKSTVNAETASPKDEFEKQTDYEKRLADFEKEKQQKILALEQDYQNRTKETVEKLKAGITFKNDIQPNWEGILKKNGSIEEYRERAEKLSRKIKKMKTKISQINGLFGKLIFTPSELKILTEHWQNKNALYTSRLEKARELMQDYIIQDQAKILTTERKKFEMSLGAYNADKEEFEFSMNDSNSKTVPFDFSGTVKISPQQARETNRQTDNFTASIDYINFPLIVGEAILYPGVKKANVFYKNQELKTVGLFKIPSGLDQHSNFSEWAIYADSLITGKLAPKNLDSLYAMSASATKPLKEKKESNPSLSGKTVFRIAMFSLSAASFGLGLWQDSEVSSKTQKANKLALEYSEAQNLATYNSYRRGMDDLEASKNLRAGFYVGAGVFGAAGVVSFFF